MTRKIPPLGLGGILLGALVVLWPAPPTLDLSPLHPADTSAPLERPDRPPHPVSVYTPPGR